MEELLGPLAGAEFVAEENGRAEEDVDDEDPEENLGVQDEVGALVGVLAEARVPGEMEGALVEVEDAFVEGVDLEDLDVGDVVEDAGDVLGVEGEGEVEEGHADDDLEGVEETPEEVHAGGHEKRDDVVACEERLGEADDCRLPSLQALQG